MPGSTLMGLLPGDCFPVLDVLYGLMLPSGNDAALSLGRHLAGSDQRFVAQLNTLLSRLGLQDSSFENPHGLDEDGHRSSAYDLAMLARYGMTLPAFVDVVQAPGWTAVGSRNVTMRNVNRFLTSYADADGVKTGFTEDAGRTPRRLRLERRAAALRRAPRRPQPLRRRRTAARLGLRPARLVRRRLVAQEPQGKIPQIGIPRT